MASGALTVDVVAPDRVLWSGNADGVSAPAADGDLGLLPGHESLLATLRPGTVRVHAGAETSTFEVETGFVSFDDDTVTVIVGGNG